MKSKATLGYEAKRDFLCDILVRAGRPVHRAYLQVKKGDVPVEKVQEFVRSVEDETNRFIIAELTEKDPEATIVSEHGSPIIRSQYRRYTIDPVDGSKNLEQGTTNIVLAIAYRESGESVVGVIHNPIGRSTMTAVKGGGTKKDGRIVHVSTVEDITRYSLEFHHPAQEPELIIRNGYIHSQLGGYINSYRAGGSSLAAMLKMVDRKPIMGIWLKILEHDCEPGIVGYREAGGLALNIDMTPWEPHHRTLVLIPNIPSLLTRVESAIKYGMQRPIDLPMPERT